MKRLFLTIILIIALVSGHIPPALAQKQKVITSSSKEMTVIGFYALGDKKTSSWTNLFVKPYPRTGKGTIDIVDELAVGWYSIDEKGNLLTQSRTGWQRPWGWEDVLKAAEKYKLSVEMVVHVTDENSTITKFLNDSNAMKKAVKAITEEAAKYYSGVNLNFEGLGWKDEEKTLLKVQQKFTTFVALLAQSLHEKELNLTLTLHAPNSAYKGYAYKALGEVADRIIIMAYDYGYDPEPDYLVKQAVEMAKAYVSPEKLILGISVPTEIPVSILNKVKIAKEENLKGIALWRLGIITTEMWNVFRTTLKDDLVSEQLGFKINQTSLKKVILKIKGDKYYCDGKEIGFYDGPAMVSLKTLAEQLGYECLNEEKNFILKKGSYSLKIPKQSRQVQKYFDGKFFEEFELWHKTDYLNNDLFVADIDLPSLFGLDKYWDAKTKDIYLNYPEYYVYDYGNYEISGETLAVKAVGKSGLSIIIKNITNKKEGTASGFYNGEKARFELNAKVPLVYGNNELQIAVLYRGRILLLKTLKNITPDFKTHELSREKIIGPWTSIKIESPQKGYIETNKSKFKIKGKITNVSKDILTVKIEKLNEQTNKYESLTPQNLLIKDNTFNGYINLESGYGIYKVKVLASVTGLHGYKGNTLAFEFFINYFD